MFGLVVIVAVVALALTMTIRTHGRLAALRRRADEAGNGQAVADYNAALETFPARLIARTLGFHRRSAEG
jgi:hypothetical protein